MSEIVLKAILNAKPGVSPDFSDYYKLYVGTRRGVCKSLVKVLSPTDLKKLVKDYNFNFTELCACEVDGKVDFIQFLRTELKMHVKIYRCCFKKLSSHVISLISPDHSESFIKFCRIGNLTEAKRHFVTHEIEIDCKCKQFGSTALMHAAQQGHVSTVEWLLETGADPLIENPRYCNQKASDYCIRVDNDYDKIRSILHQAEAKKTCQTDTLSEIEKKIVVNFWQDACNQNDAAMVKKYQDMGMPVILSRQAIMNASEYGHVDILKTAKQQKQTMDVILPNYGEHFNTPLKIAAREGRLKVVRFLIEECDIHEGYEDAMFNAIRHGKLDVVEYLANLPDMYLTNKLSYAIDLDDIPTFEMLLNGPAGKYVNCLSCNLTPLMKAVMYAKENYVELLLNAGADPTIANNCGSTAFDFANENDSIFKLLGKNNSDVKSVEDETPAQLPEDKTPAQLPEDKTPAKSDEAKEIKTDENTESKIEKIDENIYLVTVNSGKFLFFKDSGKITPLVTLEPENVSP